MARKAREAVRPKRAAEPGQGRPFGRVGEGRHWEPHVVLLTSFRKQFKIMSMYCTYIHFDVSILSKYICIEIHLSTVYIFQI